MMPQGRVDRSPSPRRGLAAIGVAVALLLALPAAALAAPEPPLPTVGHAPVTVNTDLHKATAVVTFTFSAPLTTGQGTLVVVSSPASGSTFPLGTTTVNCTVTDQCDNQATGSFTVTVQDHEPPTITCQASIVVPATAGTCGAVVTFPLPPVSDNAPGVGVPICTPASGSTFPAGMTTTVTCTVSDAASPPNTNTCSFTVTVNDTQAPAITCPSNIVVPVDAGTCSAVVVYPSQPTATDNCSGVHAVVANPPSGSRFAVGTTTVNCSVTDAAGNPSACSFTVTVQDVGAPTITCPASMTVSASPGTSTAVVNYPAPTASGPCSSSLGAIVSTPASGSRFPLGTTTVQSSVSDGNGNTASCSFTVTVKDNEAPTITCPANLTVSTAPGTSTAVVSYPAPTVSDNAPGVHAPVSSPASGSTFQLGTTTVTSSVVDAAGNSSSCSFTVTVVDSEPPTITCPPSLTVSASAGTSTAAVTFPAPTVSDNAPGVHAPVSSPVSGSTFQLGTTTVTSSVVDAAGNSSSCSFTVTVVDSEPPTITCPASRTVSADAGTSTAVVTFPAPTVSDNAPGVLAPVSSRASGSTLPLGTTSVTCSVSDAAGNTSSCSFTVTVNDNEAPTITCPANLTRSTDAGTSTAVVTFALPAVHDNAPGVGVPVCAPASGSTFPLGTTTVNCTVTDAAGNTGTCSFTVTVNDGEAPTITCPANLTQGTDAGTSTAVVTFALPAVHDNAPGVHTPVYDRASGSKFPLGTTTVHGSVSDAAGNASACSFTVTVTDGEAPQISCPANITANTDPGQCGAVVTFALPAVSDNAPGVGVPVCVPASGSTFSTGATTVVCTVADAAGNTNSCSFTVTVSDREAPTISCPANRTVGTDAGTSTAVVTFSAPVVADNCATTGPAVCTPPSGSVFALGTTTVTCTVADVAGNTAGCQFTVTVVDRESPTLTTSARSVTTDRGQCGAVVALTATFADNVPGARIAFTPTSSSFFAVGATTVTAVVTDRAGNTTRSAFVVTVSDGEAPTIACPPDVTVSTAPGQCGALVVFTSPAVADNCSGLGAPVFSPASGSFFAVGTTTAVCRVTDAAGNSASCQFNVTVNDTEPPQIFAPTDVTVTTHTCQGMIATYPLPVVSDNCPGVGVPVCTPPSGSIFAPGTTTVTCTVTDAAGNAATATCRVEVVCLPPVLAGGCYSTGAPVSPADAAGWLLPLSLAGLVALWRRSASRRARA